MLHNEMIYLMNCMANDALNEVRYLENATLYDERLNIQCLLHNKLKECEIYTLIFAGDVHYLSDGKLIKQKHHIWLALQDTPIFLDATITLWYPQRTNTLMITPAFMNDEHSLSDGEIAYLPDDTAQAHLMSYMHNKARSYH